MVVDALSCRYALLSTLEAKFLGFECLEELYEHDADFSHIYQTCSPNASNGFLNIMVIWLRIKDFVCLRVPSGKFLLKKLMRGG